MGEKWNIERANQLLSAALAEVDELGDKLSPVRAEALLDEFEHDISGAFFAPRHISGNGALRGICTPFPSARRRRGLTPTIATAKYARALLEELTG